MLSLDEKKRLVEWGVSLVDALTGMPRASREAFALEEIVPLIQKDGPFPWFTKDHLLAILRAGVLYRAAQFRRVPNLDLAWTWPLSKFPVAVLCLIEEGDCNSYEESGYEGDIKKEVELLWPHVCAMQGGVQVLLGGLYFGPDIALDRLERLSVSGNPDPSDEEFLDHLDALIGPNGYANLKASLSQDALYHLECPGWANLGA